MKKISIAYLLLLCLGMFGAHRFYLKQKYASIQFFMAAIMLYCTQYIMSMMINFVNGDINKVNEMQEKIILSMTDYDKFINYMFLSTMTTLFLWNLYDSFKIPSWVKQQNQLKNEFLPIIEKINK